VARKPFRIPKVDLMDVLGRLVEGRKLIGYILGGAIVLAILYCNLTDPFYTSQATIAPAPTGDTSSLAQYANLAASVGINLGTAADQTPFNEFVTLLRSRKLADRLANEKGFLQGVFHREWDPDTKTWHPAGVTGYIKSFVFVIFGMPGYQPPDGERLYNYLQDNLDITTNFETNFVTLSYDNPDPKFAQRFVDLVHRDSDSILREGAKQDSEQRIRYVEEELKTTTTNDARSVLIAMLSTEKQKAMLVNADRYYVADVVDPSAQTTLPSWPNVPVVLALALFFGLFAGSALVLAKDRLLRLLNWTRGTIRRWQLSAAPTPPGE
jgi:uncharacterized protein involved in exopolysaccharide biosynthesis